MSSRTLRILQSLHAMQDFFGTHDQELYPLPFSPAVRALDLQLARINQRVAVHAAIKARQQVIADHLQALRSHIRAAALRPLVTAARRQLEHVEGFSRGGLDPNTATELRDLASAVTAMEQLGRLTRTLATCAGWAVDDLIAESRAPIAVLDAMVRTRLRTNRLLWARWCRARNFRMVEA